MRVHEYQDDSAIKGRILVGLLIASAVIIALALVFSNRPSMRSEYSWLPVPIQRVEPWADVPILGISNYIPVVVENEVISSTRTLVEPYLPANLRDAFHNPEYGKRLVFESIGYSLVPSDTTRVDARNDFEPLIKAYEKAASERYGWQAKESCHELIGRARMKMKVCAHTKPGERIDHLVSVIVGNREGILVMMYRVREV